MKISGQNQPLLETSKQKKEYARLRICIFNLLAALAIYLIAVNHRYSVDLEHASGLPISLAHGWVLLQALTLLAPCMLASLALSFLHPRWSERIGVMSALTVVAVYCLDLITFSNIGERFLSGTTYRIFSTLLPSILSFATTTLVLSIAASCLVATLSAIFLAWLSRYLANRIIAEKQSSSSIAIGLIAAGFIVFLGASPLYRFRETFNEMQEHSLRNPLCVTKLVKSPSFGVSNPTGSDGVIATIAALEFAPLVQQRASSYQKLAIDEKPAKTPDILFVIVESLRRDVISPKTTPNLFALAEKGIWCKNHFSSGNATNLGMFSLLYGLESCWFERSNRMEPALPKVLSQAGYETAFFGGSEDWDAFAMDGFIGPKNFDRFETQPVNWTLSDIHMARMAEQYLRSGRSSPAEPDQDTQRPRLAILYLYSTHFDYRCEQEDEIHSPLSADPNQGRNATVRDEESFRKYLNSVHFIDRIVGPLIKDDRIVVVAGDHGEAFLEDGCRLHGIKISEVQNAASLIFAGPGIPQTSINSVTGHIDAIPTLLDAIGATVNDRTSLDGLSLIEPDQLTERLLSTRNYMRPEVAILGKWTRPNSQVFAYRAFLSLSEWTLAPANPIDRFGLSVSDQPSADNLASLAGYKQWIRHQFKHDVDADTDSVTKRLESLLQSKSPDIALRAMSVCSSLSHEEAGQLRGVFANLTKHTDKRLRDRAAQLLIVVEKRLAD